MPDMTLARTRKPGPPQAVLDLCLEPVAQAGVPATAQFRFGTDNDRTADDAVFHLHMQPLDGPVDERWFFGAPGTVATVGGIKSINHAGFLFFELTADISEDPVGATRDLYLEALGFLQQQGYPNIIKAWNSIPAINAGTGDDEVYRHFCVGRGQAMDECYEPVLMPAGTAVGTPAGNPLQVIFLAAKTAPMPMENPRQVSAFNYPRQYGPRSPSFSRAVTIPGVNRDYLLVSGTAAIVGHHSRHGKNLSAQINETLNNWTRLLGEYAGAGEQPSLHGNAAFRAYLRHPEHLDECKAVLESVGFPLNRTIFLQADICRPELLFELDGTLSVEHR